MAAGAIGTEECGKNAGTGRDVQRYTWDADANIASVNVSTTNTYDAFDKLVETSAGPTQFLYLPGGTQPFATMSNYQNYLRVFAPAPGGTMIITPNGHNGVISYHRHTDWIGSSRFASTPAETVYFDSAYAPFGEPYATSGTPDYVFGENAQDASVVEGATAGYAYDTLNRKYSAAQSRWNAPDPAGLTVVDPSNPQSWNRYAYVGNGPLNAIDPLGLNWFDWVQGGYDGSRQTCTLDGASIPCAMLQSAAQSGFAAQCPNNGCAGIRLLQGPGDSGIFQQWVSHGSWSNDGGWTWQTGTGHWQTVGTISANSSFWGYLLSKPWVVSWILPVAGPVPGVVGVGPAGGVAWNPKTHNLCVGIGLGASAGHNAAIGPLLTSSGNVDSILSGWSVSGGGNLPFPSPVAGLGWLVIANSSGVAQGPTAGVAGLSGSVTWSKCVNLF